jgi:uncharacterized protein (DUF779 family)
MTNENKSTSMLKFGTHIVFGILLCFSCENNSKEKDDTVLIDGQFEFSSWLPSKYLDDNSIVSDSISQKFLKIDNAIIDFMDSVDKDLWTECVKETQQNMFSGSLSCCSTDSVLCNMSQEFFPGVEALLHGVIAKEQGYLDNSFLTINKAKVESKNVSGYIILDGEEDKLFKDRDRIDTTLKVKEVYFDSTFNFSFFVIASQNLSL